MFYAVEKACESALAALAAGDRSALATLYERMGRSVFSVAYAVTGNYHDAEDVLQETMPDAFRCAFCLSAGDQRLRVAAFIARHKAVDCLRRASVRRAEPLDDVPAAEPGYAAVEALELLRFLDEGEREVVILCVYTARRIKNLQRCWASLSLRRRSVTSAR